MTISELIEHLKDLPQDMDVMIGYPPGLLEAMIIEVNPKLAYDKDKVPPIYKDVSDLEIWIKEKNVTLEEAITNLMKKRLVEELAKQVDPGFEVTSTICSRGKE